MIKHRLLIIGAGIAGQEVVRQIKNSGRKDIKVVAFVDDDETKQNTTIESIVVKGKISDLPKIVKTEQISQVLISTPSVNKGIVTRVSELLPPNFPKKILPSISSVILGRVDMSYVRDIDLSDLIGRPLVKANQELILKKTEGKTFLITGGAGSIGSEIVRQLYDSKAKNLVIVDAWEEGVFNLLEELKSVTHNISSRPKITAFIGNIRDGKRLEEIIKPNSIDVIIHAAAYKHVPLMEDNPTEAEKTNYFGTRNILKLASKYKINEFVLISTDKAVNPSSIMGKTKRKAELLMKKYSKKSKYNRYCAVRFGNVLNSSGSVVPKFLKQINSNLPLTITDKRMTRYFMSIPEAVSLVLLSWTIAKNGQILLLDMGQPIKIVDLAKNLIRLHGLEPNKDIDIIEVGIRPGEKLYEELSYDQNKLKVSGMDRIFIAEE